VVHVSGCFLLLRVCLCMIAPHCGVCCVTALKLWPNIGCWAVLLLWCMFTYALQYHTDTSHKITQRRVNQTTIILRRFSWLWSNQSRLPEHLPVCTSWDLLQYSTPSARKARPKIKNDVWNFAQIISGLIKTSWQRKRYGANWRINGENRILKLTAKFTAIRSKW